MKNIYQTLISLIITLLVFSTQAQTFSYSHFTTSQGLPVNNITCAMADDAGNVWFGSASGLTKYDGTNFTTYTTSNGLPDNTINRLDLALNGDILIATNNGLSRYNGSSFTNSLSGVTLKCVYQASNGNIWVGTTGGARRYISSWTTFTTADGLPHNFVNTITEDIDGNIWVGTSEGLGKYNGATWSIHTNLNGTNTDSDLVISSMKDSNGHVWFGSKPGFGVGGGVTRYDGTTWHHYNITEGLAGQQVTDMTSDSRNNIWFSTFNNGNSLFKDISYPSTYTFTTFSTAGGLINNQVNGVTIDSSGRIWFATFAGVSRLTPVSINSIITEDATCGNNFTGSATVNAGGINPPLYYSVNGGTSFQSSNIFNDLTAGTYNFIVTDSSCFVTSVDATIGSIDPIPAGLPDTVVLCQGDSIQITANEDGSNYAWTPQSVITGYWLANPLVYPSTSQYVYLTMDDENGCEVSDSTWVDIVPKTEMEIQINGNVYTCIGDFNSYYWTYYYVPIPGAVTNIWAFSDPGIYGCFATDDNGCKTYSGMLHYNNAAIDESIFQPQIYISEYLNGQITFNIDQFDAQLLGKDLKVFSIDGKYITTVQIEQHTTTKASCRISTSGLDAGMYMLYSEKSGITYKFSITE